MDRYVNYGKNLRTARRPPRETEKKDRDREGFHPHRRLTFPPVKDKGTEQHGLFQGASHRLGLPRARYVGVVAPQRRLGR
jgi:hypothetical protein